MEEGVEEPRLKGSLVDKAKPAESKLRGSLLRSEPTSIPIAESALKGTLVDAKKMGDVRESLAEESKLKGSLIDKHVVEPTLTGVGLSESAVAVGSYITNRDDGKTYRIDRLSPAGIGSNKGKMIAKLISPDGDTFSTSLDRLNDLLDTEGSLWLRK